MSSWSTEIARRLGERVWGPGVSWGEPASPSIVLAAIKKKMAETWGIDEGAVHVGDGVVTGLERRTLATVGVHPATSIEILEVK